ncbi:M phase phosphoprotein 10 isoform X3 [Populus trichocarpa]|uniref:M phase phosphoprotein 10 isoform X3 n=1 Tax=Populus trichocarpa TaxID=3694 RepID=UPI0022794708|nr:M phase phosphoprotein 10 isoform X3 [Populus trichocarpa]
MAIPSEAAAAALEALNRLKSTNPPLWLAPSPSLSQTARTACKHIFSSINPHVAKSLFDQLLIDGFDVEQIWQQIDLQSQPLLSTLRRQVLHFEKNPEEIRVTGEKVLQGKNNGVEEKEVKKIDGVGNGDDDDMDMYGIDDEDDDDDEEEEEVSEEEESGEEEGEKGVVEDKFLKIKDLEDFLEDEDAKEYGLDTKKNNKKDNLSEEDDEDEDDDEGEGGEDDEDDELGVFGDGDEEDEDASKHARYEDFFGSKRRKILKRKSKEDSSSDDELDDEAVDERKGRLSTHEKQLQKLQSEIEQMEKANLEPKTWTMQGEVTAASRPKNSALEVDLDFEHNMRPAPVITEEVTATLEDMIKNRIIEGQFNDIQKAPSLPSKAPRELKELDDNKSKKGLADVYEEEYVQKTNPAAAPLSFLDEQKKEVIEDMSIQANVPALAMEEIAPMAVSDAAMLAPEEVFSGKGDIKEEAELTQAERKRRRANKKRKFKAESVKGTAKKARENTTLYHDDGKEE